MLTILALDMSSTAIGVCYHGSPLTTITLAGDIAERCRLARAQIAAHLWLYPDVDLVAIESPVGRFAKALIPQCRVSGAVLSYFSEREIAWVELAPSEAKRALTGRGDASKALMIRTAWARLGAEVDEHQADAYGLWLAACQLKVEREVV